MHRGFCIVNMGFSISKALQLLELHNFESLAKCATYLNKHSPFSPYMQFTELDYYEAMCSYDADILREKAMKIQIYTILPRVHFINTRSANQLYSILHLHVPYAYMLLTPNSFSSSPDCSFPSPCPKTDYAPESHTPHLIYPGGPARNRFPFHTSHLSFAHFYTS